MLKAVLAGVAGGVLLYYLDPIKGDRRWATTRERVRALLPIGALSESMFQGTERAGRAPARVVQAIAHRTPRTDGDVQRDGSDAALAARVAADLRDDPDVPAEQITFRVSNGRVVLRGGVDHPELIGAIVDRVRAIPGVTDVDNRLHVAQSNARQD